MATAYIINYLIPEDAMAENITTAPTSAAAVANAFLDIQELDGGNFPPIDQMKLQKLVYYAYAWWLAYTGQQLFPEDVEAWPWGPVVRSIYGDFRDCGREPIGSHRAKTIELQRTPTLKVRVSTPAPPPPQVMEFLKGVWEQHKGFTGIQLSNATHAAGEPWTILKERLGSLDSKPRIPDELIADVFRQRINGV
jgi:uncharacterized phage-associated protein